MSLHLTLAKKVLAHAKDLLKHIFNEAGQDVKAMEAKFLEALKGHAEDELGKIEEAAKSGISGELQHWQKAPRPEDATSVHAPADLSWDETDDKEQEDDERADVPTATPSDTESETVDGDKKPEGAADGEKGDQTQKTDRSPASTVQTFPCGDSPVHGDPEAPSFKTPDRTPVTTTDDLPTEGAASHHGEAMPSSGIQSQDLADSGKGGGAGSELDLEPEGELNYADEEPKAEEPAVEEKPAEAEAPAALGGQDPAVAEQAKSEQQDAPALNGGLDAQQGEGKPAEEPAEKPTEQNTAPEADKKVETDKTSN